MDYRSQYPVAARGFLDHLRRCPSDFDILPIGFWSWRKSCL